MQGAKVGKEGGYTPKIAVKQEGNYGKIVINNLDSGIHSIFLGKARLEKFEEIDHTTNGGRPTKQGY